MRFAFNERKAGQAAALLLERAGGRLPYIKLIKLLYLADRETLIETGYPITGDRMVSMPHGPVLSQVLDRISIGQQPGAEGSSPWFEYVSEPEGFDVKLRQPPPEDGELSDYEIGVLSGIHKRYGGMNKWALRDLTHGLPEYRDPSGSMLPIMPEEILRAEGKTEAHIEAVRDDAEAYFSMRKAATS